MANKVLSYNPQVLNLLLYAGDGISFRVTVLDTAQLPVNLTGSMKAQIRSERDEPDPPDLDFDVDLTDAATGVAVLSLTGDQTASLIVSGELYKGAWDLEWTPSGEEPRTLCQGDVECRPDVSR